MPHGTAQAPRRPAQLKTSPMGSPATFEYKREPYLIVFKEEQPIKETYAGQVGTVVIEAQRLCPVGVDSRSVVIFMHPIGGTQYLPLPAALARAGIHVISCNSRYPRNDSALIMEKVVPDLRVVTKPSNTANPMPAKPPTRGSKDTGMGQ